MGLKEFLERWRGEPPSASWARLTRQYLALRKAELLVQAIEAAEQAGEKKIVGLLRAFQAEDDETIDRQVPALHHALLEAGREEEAWTVALVYLDRKARLAELFLRFPLEHQAAVLEAGLKACEQTTAIAHILGDEPCVAFYRAAAGNGYFRGRRLEEAEEAYQEALSIRRRLAQAQPQVYEPYVATTLNNLGAVLSDLRRLKEAKAAYEEARDIYRHYDIPDQRAILSSNLGKLWMEQECWGEAAEVLQEAVEEVERLRAEALNLDRRMRILRENIHTYERLLICLMKLGRYREALEVAERGKSRTLIDLLSLRDLRPRNAPPDVVQEYERMLFQARALEDRLRRAEGDGHRAEERGEWGERVQRSRQALLQMNARLRELAEVIRQHDPDFLPHAKPLNFDEILALSKDAQATLVLFRVTEAGSFVFLVFPNGTTDVVEVPASTTDTLNELLVKPVDGWVVRYYEYQAALAEDNLAEAVRAHQRWLETMEETLGVLYKQLLQLVHERLKGVGTARLVLVPNRGLAILPLHACWWEENGSRKYLLDEFVITYAPSLSVFKRCLEREKEGRKRETLLGVANPVPPGNLEFSEQECKKIEMLLGNRRCLILWRERATKAEVQRWMRGRNLLHFSCHGQYRLDLPLESSVQLAGGEKLTLGEIFEGVHLPQAWLVVLSACETGLVDFREIADEHFGLPTGFLFAGAPTVFGSLWMVNDLSTALLMAKVYEGLERDGKGKPEALRDAQRWLRDLPAQVEEAAPNDRSFARPYWWAAFQCVGT